MNKTIKIILNKREVDKTIMELQKKVYFKQSFCFHNGLFSVKRNIFIYVSDL